MGQFVRYVTTFNKQKTIAYHKYVETLSLMSCGERVFVLKHIVYEDLPIEPMAAPHIMTIIWMKALK